MVKLSGFEAQVIKAWYGVPEDFDVLSFALIAGRSGVEHKRVRRAVRGLARKGLAKFCRISWSDDGEPRGAGYSLTPLGRSALAEK